MNFSFLHPGDQIVENMARIYSRSMMTTSGGNISIPDENGENFFLEDVRMIGFEQQFGDGSGAARVVRPASPVVLLRHNGVLVAGRTILDAFNRLEVLEATAAAILQSRPRGPISPMSEQVTRDLLAAFPGL